MNTYKTGLGLFPNYFRTVGFGLLLLSIILAIFSFIEIFSGNVISVLTKNLILISLLLIAISRDKFEDELTIKLRVQAFAVSFIFGVVFAIVQPYINLAFTNNFISDKGATELLITMFVFYFWVYFIAKKRR